MPKLNGIELGEHSPLLTKGGAKRYLGPSEHDIQTAYFNVMVGKAGPEGRISGLGLTGRIPDLATLYAVPNFSGRLGSATKVQGAKLKAEGRLPALPDVHWPVARGPFIGLWIEFKIPGKYPTKDQRAMHEQLRAQGHCVVVCREVQHAVNATLRYNALGPGHRSSRLSCDMEAKRVDGPEGE